MADDPATEWALAMTGTDQSAYPLLRYEDLIAVALDEASASLAEGGVPIGAALFDATGTLLGRGRNRRLQDRDLTLHAELVAFRNAPAQADYRDALLATTHTPCWFCGGLVRQFGIGTVVIGDCSSFPSGPLTWLREAGVDVVELDSSACAALLRRYADAGGQVLMPPEASGTDRGTRIATSP